MTIAKISSALSEQWDRAVSDIARMTIDAPSEAGAIDAAVATAVSKHRIEPISVDFSGIQTETDETQDWEVVDGKRLQVPALQVTLTAKVDGAGHYLEQHGGQWKFDRHAWDGSSTGPTAETSTKFTAESTADPAAWRADRRRELADLVDSINDRIALFNARVLGEIPHLVEQRIETLAKFDRMRASLDE